MPPLTIWRPQESDGEGEITASDSANIDTESGFDLITEAGDNLIVEDLVFTPTPQTAWVEDDSK